MIVLTVVLLILILILMIRVGVRIKFDEEGFAAFVKLSFHQVQVYPPSKKKSPKEAEKPKEKKKPEDGSKKEKPKQKITVQELCQYARLGISAAGSLIRGLRVDLLELHAVVKAGDAAATAMAYGGACAAVTGVLPILEDTLRIRKKDIQIDAGFTEPGSLQLQLQITAAVGRILAIGLVYACKFLTLRRKVRKNEQSERNDE